jgi:hypothetical protein
MKRSIFSVCAWVCADALHSTAMDRAVRSPCGALERSHA